MATDLVFDSAPAPGQPVNLVFNGTSAPSLDRALTGSGVLPALHGAAPLCRAVKLAGAGVLPSLSGLAVIGGARQLVGSGTIAPLQGSAAVLYNSDTQRPFVGAVRSAFQNGRKVEVGFTDKAQPGVQVRAPLAGVYQDATPVRAALDVQWRDAIRLRNAIDGLYQQGLKARHAFDDGYQDAQARRAAASDRYQQGLKARNGFEDAFQDNLRRRSTVVDRFQHADPYIAGWIKAGVQRARQSGNGNSSRYQNGIKPAPGRWFRPPVDPPGDPCYVPDANLVFVTPWSDDTGLVFICERHAPPPEPGATVVVPVRRVYVVENHIALQRVDTGEVIEADAFAMNLDYQSWTWAWSASLPASALALTEPGGDGERVEFLATVNGVGYRLTVATRGRDRTFAKARVRVQGRGRADVLDAPRAPVLNHAGASDRTAQQLMALALTINGVSIGWDVDYGLEDWLVPGGTWSFQGTYIGAVLDIANAAGGYVQPHRTDATLRILPRYPAMPNEWGDLSPDFEIPADVASVEGIEWHDLPNYNRIFVSGTTGVGVLGQVTRAGSAGDSIAPMVTHSLITSAVAARQRGLAELANTGSQALVSLQLPVLPETGIIQPGSLVRYVDGPLTRLGLVRSTALSWQRPVLRQTLGLETHL